MPHPRSTGRLPASESIRGDHWKIAASAGKAAHSLDRQRRVILQVMDDAEQHLDVDQILERAQKIDSGVHSGNRLTARLISSKNMD